MENKVICQFCGNEMKSGTNHSGSCLNSRSFWCDCGSTCSFLKHYGKKIASVVNNVEYE